MTILRCVSIEEPLRSDGQLICYYRLCYHRLQPSLHERGGGNVFGVQYR
jgi:hypothetical protein